MSSASPPAFRVELVFVFHVWCCTFNIDVNKNNVTLGASLSLVRGLYLILMTHYDVLSLLFKLLNVIVYLKILNFHLCYFLLNIVNFICFSTCLFDNVTLCINLPNVTLSNMSYLVYITLSSETDGVTLSRLECTELCRKQNRKTGS